MAYSLCLHRLPIYSLLISLLFLVQVTGVFSSTTHRNSTTSTTIDTTSILFETSTIHLSPSPSSFEFSSSFESLLSSSTVKTSSSTSVSPLPPPVREVIVARDSCFFLEATNINFVFYDGGLRNVSVYDLSYLYRNHTDIVAGCDEDRVHTFTRNYYNEAKERVFYFILEFTHVKVDNSWHLSSALNGNLTGTSTNNSYIFDYADCGNAINVPQDLSYFCSQVQCYGHEKVDGTKALLTMENLRVEAFLKSGSTPAPEMMLCGESSPSNKSAFLIVALVIGASLTVTVMIIIASFIYKRYRYGKYNLLD